MYVTTLYFLFSSSTLATSLRVLASLFIKYLKAIKLKLSIENKDVISGFDSATLLNTLLIYIKKNIDETGNLYEISVII